ncbi:MAG: NAD(P)/FAD-dependent oxidoreductase [Pseudomonadota bacterium]
MQRYHIAIAGCGPAGLAAALLLAKQGHQITIYDQFVKAGPVGSGLMLQPTGMAVLHKLGLARKVAHSGARIDGLYGEEEHSKVVLDARYSKLGVPNAFGLGIHRASLFDVLFQAAIALPINFEAGREIAGSFTTSKGRCLVFGDGTHSSSYDLIVDASGRQTVFDEPGRGALQFGALWANVPIKPSDPFSGHLLEQRYRRAAQMVGVLPIGSRKDGVGPEAAFFWSLKQSDLPDWQSRPLDEWKAEVCALWPQVEILLDRLEDRDQITFASYSHRTLQPSVQDRLIAIGDAWHSASPQLGQGANMALLDAWSLARGMEQGRTLQEKLRLAVGWRYDHVWLYQWVTALFTPLYQSDTKWQPALRDTLLYPISKTWPASRIQAQLMSGLFGFPLASLGLSVPDYSEIASFTAAIASSESHS